MDKKYHVGSNGKPGICTATKGNCPFGGESSHFDTVASAQAYADNKNKAEYGVMGNSQAGSSDELYRRAEEMNSDSYELGGKGTVDEFRTLIESHLTMDDSTDLGRVVNQHLREESERYVQTSILRGEAVERALMAEEAHRQARDDAFLAHKKSGSRERFENVVDKAAMFKLENEKRAAGADLDKKRRDARFAEDDFKNALAYYDASASVKEEEPIVFDNANDYINFLQQSASAIIRNDGRHNTTTRDGLNGLKTDANAILENQNRVQLNDKSWTKAKFNESKKHFRALKVGATNYRIQLNTKDKANVGHHSWQANNGIRELNRLGVRGIPNSPFK